jgi:ubiquinone/menaquinone biosynthesis C-methylase UbiE
MKNGKNGRKQPVWAVEKAVRQRYAKGAARREKSLCCSVPDYDRKYLNVLPREIVEKDYGCGDPSRYLREGDTVLDLGSGSGKICYIASQIVGPKGRVIGVDFNQPMLDLARKYQKEIGDRVGYHNVEFRKGRIQDLKTNLELIDLYLKERAVRSIDGLFELEAFCEDQAKARPLIEDASVDVIVSNCVLNLVKADEKTRLFREMYRVLKKGGRVAISDIVCDEDVPLELQKDPELWSGCVSGAFREDLFLEAFAAAGFYGIQVESVGTEPFRVVNGIDFRSMTVTARKGKEGPCLERNQAVIYKGPWKEVLDDDQHVLKRGVRTAVCDKTYQIFSKEPYRENIILVPPRKDVPLAKARVFDCHRSQIRDPRETKGSNYRRTTQSADTACDTGGSCC